MKRTSIIAVLALALLLPSLAQGSPSVSSSGPIDFGLHITGLLSRWIYDESGNYVSHEDFTRMELTVIRSGSEVKLDLELCPDPDMYERSIGDPIPPLHCTQHAKSLSPTEYSDSIEFLWGTGVSGTLTVDTEIEGVGQVKVPVKRQPSGGEVVKHCASTSRMVVATANLAKAGALMSIVRGRDDTDFSKFKVGDRNLSGIGCAFFGSHFSFTEAAPGQVG